LRAEKAADRNHEGNIPAYITRDNYVADRAKPVEKKRMEFRRSVVIATASDGYRAVFSWAELYLSPIADGVLVVYERDGAPLDDNEGLIALVSLKDTRPGPRHVRWLQSIELRALND
jgi:hypothetical protein